MSTILDWARARARQRYGSATAFRVGLMIGATYFEIENPYSAGSHRARHFKEGVEYARKRHATPEPLSKPEPPPPAP